MTSAYQSSTERHSGENLLLKGAVILLSLVVAIAIRTPMVDDAYITFRYAYHFGAGDGLIYNLGERTLGVTTPLWAALLALFRPVFGSFEATALVLCCISAVLIAELIRKDLLIELVGVNVSLLIFPLLFLTFPLHIAIFSGMESVPYTLAVLYSLSFLHRGAWLPSALASIAAVLLRPDGLIVVGVCAFILLRREGVWAGVKFGAVIALAVTPLLFIAHEYYGYVIPQSVEAKRIIHSGSPGGNAQIILLALFAQRPLEFALATLGAIGFLRMARDGRFRPHAVWLLLYMAGIVVSGVKPVFYWYYSPVWILLSLLGAPYAIRYLSEASAPAVRRLVFPMAAAAVVVASIPYIHSPDAGVQRDTVYHQVVNDFLGQIPPQETLYLCETGILGFGFLQNYVYDSSGINSTRVLAHRRAQPRTREIDGRLEVDPDRVSLWSVELVKELEPAWIISPRYYCQLAVMEDQTWFKERYALQKEYSPELLGGVRVYRARPKPSPNGL